MLESMVTAVARKFGGDRQPGGYGFELSDGVFVDMFMDDASDHAMVALRAMSSEMARFLFEVMETTGWALIVDGAPPSALMSKEAPMALVYEGFPSITVVKSPESLRDALSSPFGRWADYRDQVIGQ
jgi:hypothetical protein